MNTEIFELFPEDKKTNPESAKDLPMDPDAQGKTPLEYAKFLADKGLYKDKTRGPSETRKDIGYL